MGHFRCSGLLTAFIKISGQSNSVPQEPKTSDLWSVFLCSFKPWANASLWICWAAIARKESRTHSIGSKVEEMKSLDSTRVCRARGEKGQLSPWQHPASACWTWPANAKFAQESTSFQLKCWTWPKGVKYTALHSYFSHILPLGKQSTNLPQIARTMYENGWLSPVKLMRSTAHDVHDTWWFPLKITHTAGSSVPTCLWHCLDVVPTWHDKRWTCLPGSTCTLQTDYFVSI